MSELENVKRALASCKVHDNKNVIGSTSFNIDLVDLAETDLKAYMEREEWQPIETLIADDIDILVCGGTFSDETTGFEFYGADFKGVALVHVHEDEFINGNYVYLPTHFMIPKPPKQETKE